VNLAYDAVSGDLAGRCAGLRLANLKIICGRLPPQL
jgi:hypothetical protein